MEYAIVSVPVAAVRKKPRHQRELTNQLLFGDAVKVLKEKGDWWIKIRSLNDGYEGWLTRTLVEEVTDAVAGTKPAYITKDLFTTITINGQQMVIPAGSSLPDFENGKGKIGSLVYEVNGPVVQCTQQSPNAVLIEQLSKAWLNAPYLWGGKTVMGVDCSGFVQVNYKLMGIDMPRDAWQQAQVGVTVKKLKDAIAGDLAFFDDKDEIVHVGILLTSDTIIHSSGRVRIDTIDKKGIISSTTGKRTHSLRSIKRCW